MTAAAPPQLTSTQRTRATIDNVLGITARERQLEDQERYGVPAGRLMLTVLSGIAEFERDLILQRTNEGRLRAMAEGTGFGRRS